MYRIAISLTAAAPTFGAAKALLLLLFACLLLLPGCGGDSDDEGAPTTAVVETEMSAATSVEEETVEETDAPDSTVGGARVACKTKVLTVTFTPDRGAAFSAEGRELTTSGKLRTESVYGYAEGCSAAGSKGGAVAEPFEVIDEAATLTCTAPKNIELSGRAAMFDNKPGYELSAAAAGSRSFFLKTHYEARGGTAYLLYAPAYCNRA